MAEKFEGNKQVEKTNIERQKSRIEEAGLPFGRKAEECQRVKPG